MDKDGKDDIIISGENNSSTFKKVEPKLGFGERQFPDYITFFPHALHPGLVVCTRLIIDDIKDIGAGVGAGVADLMIGGADT